eukprot:3843918-Rhodomonas_salina.1
MANTTCIHEAQGSSLRGPRTACRLRLSDAEPELHVAEHGTDAFRSAATRGREGVGLSVERGREG